nr:hypothetical protein [Tanacetum cinerariifolium]
MESGFHISNCAAKNQVKFPTCTLHSVALTWWNTRVQTVGYEAAYGMTWKTLMKMMTEKYCPQNEIRKLEMELCELKVKGTDLTVGHEAAYGMSWKTLMKMMTDKYCPRNEIRKLEMELWELKESDKVEKYVGGLPDM